MSHAVQCATDNWCLISRDNQNFTRSRCEMDRETTKENHATPTLSSQNNNNPTPLTNLPAPSARVCTTVGSPTPLPPPLLAPIFRPSPRSPAISILRSLDAQSLYVRHLQTHRPIQSFALCHRRGLHTPPTLDKAPPCVAPPIVNFRYNGTHRHGTFTILNRSCSSVAFRTRPTRNPICIPRCHTPSLIRGVLRHFYLFSHSVLSLFLFFCLFSSFISRFLFLGVWGVCGVWGLGLAGPSFASPSCPVSSK